MVFLERPRRRLQRADDASVRDVLVESVAAARRRAPVLCHAHRPEAVDESLVIDRTTFAHPVFDDVAVAAQALLPSIRGGGAPSSPARTTATDSTRTASRQAYGRLPDWARRGDTAPLVPLHGRAHASRSTPRPNAFRHPVAVSGSTWTSSRGSSTDSACSASSVANVVSLRARDHLGDPRRTVRDNVSRTSATRGSTSEAAGWSSSRCSGCSATSSTRSASSTVTTRRARSGGSSRR